MTSRAISALLHGTAWRHFEHGYQLADTVRSPRSTKTISPRVEAKYRNKEGIIIYLIFLHLSEFKSVWRNLNENYIQVTSRFPFIIIISIFVIVLTWWLLWNYCFVDLICLCPCICAVLEDRFTVFPLVRINLGESRLEVLKGEVWSSTHPSRKGLNPLDTGHDGTFRPRIISKTWKKLLQAENFRKGPENELKNNKSPRKSSLCFSRWPPFFFF